MSLRLRQRPAEQQCGEEDGEDGDLREAGADVVVQVRGDARADAFEQEGAAGDTMRAETLPTPA